MAARSATTLDGSPVIFGGFHRGFQHVHRVIGADVNVMRERLCDTEFGGAIDEFLGEFARFVIAVIKEVGGKDRSVCRVRRNLR